MTDEQAKRIWDRHDLIEELQKILAETFAGEDFRNRVTAYIERLQSPETTIEHPQWEFRDPEPWTCTSPHGAPNARFSVKRCPLCESRPRTLDEFKVAHAAWHVPVQHRDGKPPWCPSCGLTAAYTVPESAFKAPSMKPYRPGDLPTPEATPDRVINIRAGFHHIHSGQYECGMAYVDRSAMFHDGKTIWARCSKLLNHDDLCGYADNTPF